MAKLDPKVIDLSLWTTEELSDFVRHFDYDTDQLREYLLRKMEESHDTKVSDEMFDFDEESGPSKGKGTNAGISKQSAEISR